jgi:exopolysaccharide production protein ExoY
MNWLVDANSLSKAVTAPMRASVAPVGMPLKRVADVVIAVSAIVLLAPLLVICYLSIVVTSSGPALFRQRLVGFGGKHFERWKFRTMATGVPERLRRQPDSDPVAVAEWAAHRTLRRDPRVTAIGAILRKSRLDELPQLFNVLRGDMSIVGPCPVIDAELKIYGSSTDAYLSCRPGITGLWQVSGRSSTTYDKRVALDAFYARNWSLALDFKIMLVTIPVMFTKADEEPSESRVSPVAAQSGQALDRWQTTAECFFAGLALGVMGASCWIFGIGTSSYGFQLGGTGALAAGCVAATLALLRGEQLEEEIDSNGV